MQHFYFDVFCSAAKVEFNPSKKSTSQLISLLLLILFGSCVIGLETVPEKGSCQNGIPEPSASLIDNNNCGQDKVNQMPKDQVSSEETMSAAARLVALEFEVFGRVQGVFFRKYTVKKGKELGLRGWCRNTSQGTVVGEVEGPLPQVNQMKDWLANTGSPQSKIEKADFRNEKNIENYKFSSFDVRK